MWFGFGLITLVTGFFLSLYSRTQANWRGERCSIDGGRSYELQVNKNKGRIVRVRIGIPASPGFEFTARAETGRDRFFKRLGISVELQTGDADFDDAVYLEADARGVGDVFRLRPEMRAAVLGILQSTDTFSVKAVRCSHKRLWIECRPRENTVLNAAGRALVPHLDTLAKNLLASHASMLSLRDPFIRRAALLLSISTASALLGVFGLLRATAGKTDILDEWRLLNHCVVPGFLLTFGFLYLILRTLGHSSRTHLVLLEGAFIGSIGFVLSIFALAREIDMEFDWSAPQDHVVHDARTAMRVGNRNSRSYYLYATDWHEGREYYDMTIQISAADYALIGSATNVVIQTGRGALGYEWLRSIRPLPPALEK